MNDSATTDSLLLNNARLVDGSSPTASAPMHVLIEDGRIRQVSSEPITAPGARSIDLEGRTLMPGLIDCHVHVIATTADLGANALLPDSLVTARATPIMRDMLKRGFTTVRDVGGADHGLKTALEEGHFAGPRLVICGKALSQTGGHNDYRGFYDERDDQYQTRRLGSMGRLCDGVDAVRKAARQEIKGGAQFIKVMANGGVSSPSDPIDFLSFSQAELEAIVEEASNAQTYVSAHLYTDQAIHRAVEAGVHSLEHCNLITLETARLAAERGAFACPTLVTYEMLKREGADYGLKPASIAKIDDVRLAGLDSLKIMREAGLTMAYGTDLLGAMHRHQSEEFVIRSRVLPVHEVIRSATLDAARLLRMEGEIGCIAPGAHADLIVVDGNPLEDISLLTGQGRHFSLILQGGHVVQDTLQAQ
ncbi:metal-dependent hydrolase family protein [Kushneria phosphatilytica]|uniref:Amidohydrolase family protein n=1 Tax=Kushneria phosphatilytica TaxID=657387 RepID=A0A1S1NSS0_9GAMM|nr:amidohydrolase family protein [Kushneria phosphatilytica]OHV08393.1 peptidase M38 [Kushneria phosphatilytica]QEL09816.1 amidohydrolase family protein [Kushneria phosphatilytica]